ncbi:15874_t:CDS:2, partial [Gigaspora margarita]
RTLYEVLGTRFTKSELKSIKEDLLKDQKHKDLSLLFAQKLKIGSMGIVPVKNYKDRLSQYRQEILMFPLLDPFWCHIANFEKSDSIWNKMFERSLLSRFRTECFELNPNQANDVIKIVITSDVKDYAKFLNKFIFSPEHPAHKSLFEKSEDDPLDNNESVQETVIIIQNVHDEPIYLLNKNK